MPCCKAEIYGWCKDLPVVDYKDGKDNEYCIFHAPEGEKRAPVEKFNKLVFERINEAKKKNKLCDLSGTVFVGDIDFIQFNENNPLPPISFSDTTFNMVARFFLTEFSGLANFSQAKFSKEANFRWTKFREEVHFSGAIFSVMTEFIRAKFNGKAFFSGTKFREGADFSVATFNGAAKFFMSEFSGLVNFVQTEFKKEADFGGATFTGITRFFETGFNGKIDFLPYKIREGVYFDGAIFNDIAKFIGTKFTGGASFSGETFMANGYFQCTYINEKLRFEGINLKKVSFIDTDLRKIDLINCNWPKNFGRYILYDERAFFNEVKSKNLITSILQRLKHRFISFDKKKIKKVEILYRRLKQKYKEEHNEPEVSNWHYGEKEMFRKGSLFRRYFPLSLSNLYWFSSGYGERPVRAGVMLFLLILAISILFGLAGLSSLNQNPSYGIAEIKGWADITNFQNFWTLILNTLQYATFEKEPDFMPTTIYGGYLKLAARILIPLQAALFALAVRNRFRR